MGTCSLHVSAQLPLLAPSAQGNVTSPSCACPLAEQVGDGPPGTGGALGRTMPEMMAMLQNVSLSTDGCPCPGSRDWPCPVV